MGDQKPLQQEQRSNPICIKVEPTMHGCMLASLMMSKFEKCYEIRDKPLY